MPKYSFVEKDKRYLSLEMSDGKTYNLPLAGSMKLKELRKLVHIQRLDEVEQFDLMFKFLAEHMGEAVVDELTQDEAKDIFSIWTSASNGTFKEDSGRTLGESSASSD